LGLKENIINSYLVKYDDSYPFLLFRCFFSSFPCWIFDAKINQLDLLTSKQLL